MTNQNQDRPTPLVDAASQEILINNEDAQEFVPASFALSLERHAAELKERLEEARWLVERGQAVYSAQENVREWDARQEQFLAKPLPEFKPLAG